MLTDQAPNLQGENQVQEPSLPSERNTLPPHAPAWQRNFRTFAELWHARRPVQALVVMPKSGPMGPPQWDQGVVSVVESGVTSTLSSIVTT